MPCRQAAPCGQPRPKPCGQPKPCQPPAPTPKPSCGGCKSGAPAPDSALERQLRDAADPVFSSETEEITANGESGIHANRSETASWRSKDGKGVAEYEFFNDPNPEVIRRKGQKKYKYTQEIEVKFLRPPQPPSPPPITVFREGDIPADAPPPVVIVQPGQPAGELEPTILRERPPRPPPDLCPKRVTIPGNQQPPPPRKVIIERLPDEPCKPGKITIERWLGYGRQRRQVVLENGEKPCPAENPRNLIVEWEAADVEIEKKYVCLGTQEADPEEYLRQYSDFAQPCDLDTGDCQPDCGVLAVDAGEPETPELFGELNALREIDLDANGLSEYRDQL